MKHSFIISLAIPKVLFSLQSFAALLQAKQEAVEGAVIAHTEMKLPEEQGNKYPWSRSSQHGHGLSKSISLFINSVMLESSEMWKSSPAFPSLWMVFSS